MVRSFNSRVADLIAGLLGSMWTFWFISLTLALWMIGQPLFHGFDPYPYPLALFVGNLCQLLGMLVLQVTQNRQSARQQQMMDHLETLVAQIKTEEEQELQILPKAS